MQQDVTKRECGMATRHKLLLTCDKTKETLVNTEKKPCTLLPLTVDETEMGAVTEAKLLGVAFLDTLG